MWTFTSIREQAAKSGHAAGRVFTVVQSQPSWVTRITLSAATLVLAAVILLLVIPTILVAAAVFVLLAYCNAAFRSLRSLLRPTDRGRRNVRVIRRQ